MVLEALRSKRLSLYTKLSVSKRASRHPSSKLGLKKDQTITVRKVIGALITKSANDADSVMAE